MAAEDLEQRLTLLEAQVAITRLVHSYANFVATSRAGQCGDLFTEDGVFEIRARTADGGVTVQSKTVGRAAVRDHIAEAAPGVGGLVPQVHNLVIDVQGDTATSECVMVGGIGFGEPRFMGMYQDSYRRDPDWRFSHRTYTIFAMRPA